MTDRFQNNSSDSITYNITALEAQLASNPKNPSFHAHLAWAYLEAGRFDEAIEGFETCYKININNRDKIHAAKAAGEIGHCFFKRTGTAGNRDSEEAQDWLDAMKWKKQEYRLISTLINSDPSKKHDLAMIAGKIGQEYLDASQRLRQANSKQADEYWLNGIKWKKKSWHFDEKLSWTDKSTIERTIENCAKTAGHIGQEYLKASKRLQQASPEQAKKYWLEGMAWKEKAYGSYKELSHTDSSKKQDCALTAAQLGKEFANQENFEEAIEWYEKALEHNPDNEFIIKRLEALEEALEILAAHQEVKRQRS